MLPNSEYPAVCFFEALESSNPYLMREEQHTCSWDADAKSIHSQKHKFYIEAVQYRGIQGIFYRFFDNAVRVRKDTYELI